MKRLYTDSQGSQDEQAEEMRVYGIRMPDQAQVRATASAAAEQ